MANESNFKEVLARAIDGDVKAEAILYEKFLPSIERFIEFRLRDLNILWAVEPPDIYDSVWRTVRHSKSLAGLQDAMQFSRYLKGAVRNKTLQVRRRLTAVKRDFRITTSQQGDSRIDGDDDPAVAAELAELLIKVSDQLTTVELAVCALFCEGLCWNEIGTRLDMTADAARMIRFRAEKRIRLWLDHQGT